MSLAWLALLVPAAYLSGSVSYAILVTRGRTGKDIRDLGNKNPGTANVGRTVGRGWGTLVLLLDVLKGLVPMLAARLLFFPGSGSQAILAVFAVGLAAIVGHCLPLLHGFRGGGGVGTSLGVYFFFTPLEFAASMLLGSLVVFLFIRGVQFRLGRWIPIMFVAIAPFLTLAVNLFVSVPLGAHLSLGGHPWSVTVGVFATSIVVLFFNARLLLATLKNPQEATPRSQ
jgi:glycerol-3-phosphate acyltransferase PlsY